MGVRIYENGHSYTGVKFSIHSNYAAVSEYEQAMEEALRRGARARDPGRGAPQHGLLPERDHQGRHPGDPRGAADRGRPHTDRELDVPACRARRMRSCSARVMYSRLINAPTSVVGHDDRHCYRAIQEGLAADGNDWVSLHRNYSRRRARRHRRRLQRHERGVDARPVPRLGAFHDTGVSAGEAG